MCKDRISFTGNLSIHLVNVQRGLCVPLIAHFFLWLFIASIHARNPFGGIQALDLAFRQIDRQIDRFVQGKIFLRTEKIQLKIYSFYSLASFFRCTIHSISFYTFLSICLPFIFFCFEHSSQFTFWWRATSVIFWKMRVFEFLSSSKFDMATWLTNCHFYSKSHYTDIILLYFGFLTSQHFIHEKRVFDSELQTYENCTSFMRPESNFFAPKNGPFG